MIWGTSTNGAMSIYALDPSSPTPTTTPTPLPTPPPSPPSANLAPLPTSSSSPVDWGVYDVLPNVADCYNNIDPTTLGPDGLPSVACEPVMNANINQLLIMELLPLLVQWDMVTAKLILFILVCTWRSYCF